MPLNLRYWRSQCFAVLLCVGVRRRWRRSPKPPLLLQQQPHEPTTNQPNLQGGGNLKLLWFICGWVGGSLHIGYIKGIRMADRISFISIPNRRCLEGVSPLICLYTWNLTKRISNL